MGYARFFDTPFPLALTPCRCSWQFDIINPNMRRVISMVLNRDKNFTFLRLVTPRSTKIWSMRAYGIPCRKYRKYQTPSPLRMCNSPLPRHAPAFQAAGIPQRLLLLERVHITRGPTYGVPIDGLPSPMVQQVGLNSLRAVRLDWFSGSSPHILLSCISYLPSRSISLYTESESDVFCPPQRI